MILMGVLGGLLSVEIAIILHGVAQFSSNLSRAYIHKDSIQWKFVGMYLIGAILMAIVLYLLSIRTEKSIMYLFLGLFGILGSFKRLLSFIKFNHPLTPIICGALVCTGQIISGAAGPLLDVFFYQAGLNRYKVIATKAMTQVFAHSLKVIFYLLISKEINTDKLSALVILITVLTPISGSLLGKRILGHLSEKSFASFSKNLIVIISIVFIFRGLRLLLP